MTVRRLSYLAPMAMVACLGALPVAGIAQTTNVSGDNVADPESTDAEAAAPVRRLGDVETKDYDLGLIVPRSSAPAVTIYDLPDPEQNTRLQGILSRLAARPGDQAALAALDALLREVLNDAYALMEELRLVEADQRLSVVRNVNPRQEGLAEARRELDALMEDDPATRSSQSQPGGADESSPYTLPIAAQTKRLDELLSILARNPGQRGAVLELESLLEDVLAQAEVATDNGDFAKSKRLLGVVRNVDPRKAGLAEARRNLGRAMEVDDLLKRARVAEREGRLLEPPADSAYVFYRQARALDSDNDEAARGLLSVQQAMIDFAIAAAENLDFERAEIWLTEASGVREPQDLVRDARNEIEAFRVNEAGRIEEDVRAALSRREYELAEFRLIDLIALGGYEDRVAVLKDEIAREQIYGQFEPGQVVQDRFQRTNGYAPAVVVIAPGSFLMGATPDDTTADDDERPLHRVTIDRGFGMGAREVTVSEFGVFVQETGYRTQAEATGNSLVWDDELGRLSEREGVSWRRDYSGRLADGALPVLHVSWDDAQAYLRWLSEATGQRYRLPTEAEFEYAMRAGRRTVYWWGDVRPQEVVENLSGAEDQSASGRRFSNPVRGYGDGHWGPAPGGSFQPNPWGLFDTAGNVSEWVQDCWHSNFIRAPVDGSAWENPGCERRVVRGGYWASAPAQARSSARISAPQGLHAPQLGFRVVREL